MAEDDPANDLRVTPGGMISSLPSHLAGLRGSRAYLSSLFSIDGFLNLACLNGQVALPFMETTPNSGFGGTLLLGGLTVGSGDTVDVTTQLLLGQLFFAQRDSSGVPSAPVFNGEAAQTVTQLLKYGAFAEAFTTAGTVTVAAGSNIITGAGTAWTTDVLSGAYLAAANKSQNLILPGDVIGVNNAGATARNWFRILSVTDNTHLVVFPTPTAGNASIGAGRGYQILRTGYGSYSRGIPLVCPDGNLYFYYTGNAYTFNGAYAGHGVVEAIQFSAATPNHFQGPTTVNILGASTGFFPRADDLAYYKGFLLYGADTAVSWSKGGFPFGNPFTATDLPAANITVVDPTSKFVTFEYLGDQLLAIFEESIWLISATGSIPEFAFYRMPETLSVIHTASSEPCGIDVSNAKGLVYGRPSCTGRGAVFYASDRGIEQLSGGLSQEVSAPIQDILGASFGLGGDSMAPAFLSWSDDFDLLWCRPAWGLTGKVLVYNPTTQDWSIFSIPVPTAGGGDKVNCITAGMPVFTRTSDQQRLWHVGFYTTLTVNNTAGGVVYGFGNTPDNGGQAPTTNGPSTWKWRTNIIPLGLRYPDFSLAGFIPDLWAPKVAGLTVNWSLYGGDSPYNMFLRDSGVWTPTNTDPAFSYAMSPWTSSRARFGKKVDDPFVMIELSSTYQISGIAGIILLNANTQVKR